MVAAGSPGRSGLNKLKHNGPDLPIAETEHCGLDPFKICNSKESEDYNADRVATLSISRCLFGTYENCKGLEVKMDLTP